MREEGKKVNRGLVHNNIGYIHEKQSQPESISKRYDEPC